MRIALACLLVLLPLGAPATTPSPYAGEQRRAIKALSEKEIADLRAGRGMGYAKAAELNGYPGPLHVLEHADALRLTPDQRARTQALFDAMQREASALGEAVVEEERQLDRAFADGTIDEATLAAHLRTIADLQAKLREVHLRTHLRQKALLAPGQVARYIELRGYGDAAAHDGHHHGH